jgi:hypothetical protein
LRFEPRGDRQGFDRYAIDNDGDEHLPLMVGQLVFDSVTDRVDKFAPERMVLWRDTETIGHGLPVFAVECNPRALPEVTPELRGDLEHDEPVRPSRKAALPWEQRELRDHGQNGVVRSLVSEIVQLRSCDTGSRTSTPNLRVGNPEEQLVQSLDGVVSSGADGTELA